MLVKFTAARADPAFRVLLHHASGAIGLALALQAARVSGVARVAVAVSEEVASGAGKADVHWAG